MLLHAKYNLPVPISPPIFLLCYWAVGKLGFSATELSKKLSTSQPTVSIWVERSEKIAKTEQFELEEH